MSMTDHQIARLQARITAGERQRERLIADRKASILTATEASMLIADVDAKLADMRRTVEMAAIYNLLRK